MTEQGCPYVSRGGWKLAAALDAFAIDPAGRACADLGSNVGGFVDCLLQRGAARAYAIDTGYGQLAWTLRNDPRVVVLERTNALHFDPWHELADEPFVGVRLVTIDLGWTRQTHAVPAALRWLRIPLPLPGASVHPVADADVRDGRIITLIKPHYEADRSELSRGGILDEAEAQRIARRALDAMPGLHVEVIDSIRSPILGGAGKGKRGNVEYLALLKPINA
jgi:23S rRNA (cytidine1920-2'-O)/16S rRNA (cytidine1409-2'-O)-methyltransferase